MAGTSYLTETGGCGNAQLIDVDGDEITDFVPINYPQVFAQHRLFWVGLDWFFQLRRRCWRCSDFSDHPE